jgi:hypothetical protein
MSNPTTEADVAAPRRFDADQPETKYIFDHIPKTGGTALRTNFEQIFGPENVSPWISGRSELWAERRFSHFKMITGHFQSPVPMPATKHERVRITMLRDPIDRAVSEYFYYRNHVERIEWNKLAIFAKDHDLYTYVKLLDANRDAAVSNFYTRRFASQVSRALVSERRILSLAKQALAHYDFIGIQEQFADSVDMFCCRFELPLVPQLAQVNVTTSRAKLSELDARTREKLADMNRLDVELYEYAYQHLQDQKRAIFRTHAGKGMPKATPGDLDDWASARERAADSRESFGDRMVEISDASVIGSGSGTKSIRSGEETSICIGIVAHIDVPDLTVGIEISDELGEIVFGTNTYLMHDCRPVCAGHRYHLEFRFDANLMHGRYFVGASLHTGATHETRCFHWCERLTTFDVADEGSADFVGYCRLEPRLHWTDQVPARAE